MKPPLAQVARFWLKFGFISFGGPSGQIALMHAELVERRGWIPESRFLDALNFCMLLPGPEAHKLAIYCGWFLHRSLGGIIAGVLFILPSAVLLWVLSWIYVTHGDVPWIASVFYGLQPAVIAVIAVAVIRLGRRILRNGLTWLLAGISFVSIFVLKVPFPLILAGAALVGVIVGTVWPSAFALSTASDRGQELAPAVVDSPSFLRSAGVFGACISLWLAPVVAVGCWRGWGDTSAQLGVFFSKAAMVTFGGAYAVLPFVAQQAVENYGWLSAEQMVNGLALAESTPGPLIIVLQFVGFLAGWQHPGALSPLVAATVGAAVTTWATFLPSFLFVLVGAPYMDRLRRVRALSFALSAITAAVVGIMCNLGVWFAMHVVFPRGEVDLFAAALTAGLFAIALRWKWDAVFIILAGAAAGIAYRMFL